MGYVLRNGKRYYQDANGRLTLDNVSQEEADRREIRYSNTSQNSIPGGMVIMVVAVLLLFGAYLYNNNHVSMAERAISEYMQSLIYGDMDEYEEEMNESNIWPDAAERYLDTNEINDYSKEEIQMMINEIYARHGRKFRSEELGGYFNSFEWYNPISEKTDAEIVEEFNKYERANVDLLSKFL